MAKDGAQERSTEQSGSVQQSHHMKIASQEPEAIAGEVVTFCSVRGMGASLQARSIWKTTTGSVRGVNSEGSSWESWRSCKAKEEPAELLDFGGCSTTSASPLWPSSTGRGLAQAAQRLLETA